MPGTQPTSRVKVKSIVALLLTVTAGEVDIIGYITVYHFFVAHMTGTTVHLGNKLAIRAWTDALRAGVTILSFVVGSIVGRSIIEVGARAKRRTVATITLLAEAGLILIFVWIRPGFGNDLQAMPLWVTCILLALLATAMGLQTATLTRIGPLTVHTTFVTGMLNKFAQTLSQWLFWLHDQWRAHATWEQIIRGSRRHTELRNAQFVMFIWLSYAVGSLAGTWMNSRWASRALYLPVLILVLSAVIDQVFPLSIEEEKEQA